jgi:hypothetical protein
MKNTDLYLHADEYGAATTIIKNHFPHRDISPVSINQAGAAAICRSKAWDSKVVTSAWWVYPRQVSKTAPTGEALGTGSFMIRGRKNYLPPTPLVMGFTFLFRLDEDSFKRHEGERSIVGGEGVAVEARDAGYEEGGRDNAEVSGTVQSETGCEKGGAEEARGPMRGNGTGAGSRGEGGEDQEDVERTAGACGVKDDDPLEAASIEGGHCGRNGVRGFVQSWPVRCLVFWRCFLSMLLFR